GPATVRARGLRVAALPWLDQGGSLGLHHRSPPSGGPGERARVCRAVLPVRARSLALRPRLATGLPCFSPDLPAADLATDNADGMARTPRNPMGRKYRSVPRCIARSAGARQVARRRDTRRRVAQAAGLPR